MPARCIALIPAAGAGRRFGGDLPKQYVDVAGKTLLGRTLARLSGTLALDAIFVALAPNDAWYRTLVGEQLGVATLYCGGATRARTVANALAAIAHRCVDDDWILVHDAARPCVPADALLRLVDELRDDPVGGLLAIPVADTLKREDRATPARVLQSKDRSGLWQAQAPQMFRYHFLRDALARPEALEASDEAEAVEGLAGTGACALPSLIAGSALNINITFPADLALAAAIIGIQESEC